MDSSGFLKIQYKYVINHNKWKQSKILISERWCSNTYLSFCINFWNQMGVLCNMPKNILVIELPHCVIAYKDSNLCFMIFLTLSLFSVPWFCFTLLLPYDISLKNRFSTLLHLYFFMFSLLCGTEILLNIYIQNPCEDL